MSGTQIEREQPEEGAEEQAREGLTRAETGDAAGVEQVEGVRETVPTDVEGVEQEASEGPDGLGLER